MSDVVCLLVTDGSVFDARTLAAAEQEQEQDDMFLGAVANYPPD
jgi:hypothetical protein